MGLTGKRQEGSFWGDRNVLYLDWGDNNIGKCICLILSNLSAVHFTVYKFYLDKKKFKRWRKGQWERQVKDKET